LLDRSRDQDCREEAVHASCLGKGLEELVALQLQFVLLTEVLNLFFIFRREQTAGGVQHPPISLQVLDPLGKYLYHETRPVPLCVRTSPSTAFSLTFHFKSGFRRIVPVPWSPAAYPNKARPSPPSPSSARTSSASPRPGGTARCSCPNEPPASSPPAARPPGCRAGTAARSSCWLLPRPYLQERPERQRLAPGPRTVVQHQLTRLRLADALFKGYTASTT
jgi:hypothetical protein